MSSVLVVGKEVVLVVVARALVLGVPVGDDQGVDADQQERLEVGVFPEACGPEPGVKCVSGWLLPRAPEKPLLGFCKPPR